jgi:5'(3')-deoxyribonucleotidase
MSPNNQHLASVTLMGQILELYDLSDTTITRRLENIYNFPNVMYRDGVVRDTEKTIWGFPCITSDNTYIYASLIDSRDPNVFNHIAVFDWNGNGVLKLTTDYNVLRLAISGNDLYAIVANMDNELFLAKYAVNEMIAR